MKGVVEGFYAEAIAGAEKALLRVIPNGEGPHAVKVLQTLLAPFLVSANDYFGICVATKRDSGLLQFFADFFVVIDLSVERDRVRTVLCLHRLISRGRNVQYGETPVAQADNWVRMGW